MSDNPVVAELVKKLQLFRDTVQPLRKGGLIKSSLIPLNIRAEAVNIYKNHGGLDILMDILHVSSDQIREWSKAIGTDPNYLDSVKSSVTPDPAEVKKFPKKRAKKKIAKTKHDFTSENSGELKKKCEELKIRIEAYKSKHNGTIGYELKREIGKLINETGDHKPIALLLGISEKVVAAWKYFYSERDDILDLSD